MSNLSLKEQLQALTGNSSTSANAAPSKKAVKQPIETSATKSPKSKPAWLEQARYGVELLKAHYPACFKENKEINPLKIGIKQELIKHLSTRDDIVMTDKACMISSLTYYVNSPSYHRHVLEGAVRVDLNGQAAGVVTSEEARYSAERYQAKLQKKKQDE